MEKKIKPAQFAEKQIMEAILDFTYKPGQVLPAERVLAQLLGVTRPTLRETLQRLSKEGWVTIQHGKPTKVNDYLKTGGLSMLSSLARYGQHLSADMVVHLLEVRTTMLPDIAQKAVSNNPEKILNYLEKSKTLRDSSKEFALYDWGLQICMVQATHNPVFNMILNDFAPLYEVLGKTYFHRKSAREASLKYYGDLIMALDQNPINIKLINTKPNIKPIVEKIMILTQKIWQDSV
jgi:GntR family negative regulator for fad regulon and positive regulator of fabA